MKKIKSMCVLCLANLGCMAEGIDISTEDKKHHHAPRRVEKICTASPDNTENWFKDYLNAHREIDVMSKDVR